MIKLTERQQKILNTLQACGGTASGKNIASMLGLSLRTVQTDASALKKAGLIDSGQNGYVLKYTNTAVSSSDSYDDEAGILISLLKKDTPVDIDEFSDDNYISTTTMRRRLKDIEPLLEKHSLRLMLENNMIQITGSELNKRRLIRDMLFQDAAVSVESFSSLQPYFEGINVSILESIVTSSIESNGYFIQAPYMSGLMLGVIICLYRVYRNKHTPEYIQDYNHSSSEYIIAKTIGMRFEEHYDAHCDESDIIYIATLFEGQIFSDSRQTEITAPEVTEEEIRSILTDQFENLLFTVDTPAYLRNLTLHVNELVRRCHANNYAVNASCRSLKENSPFIYDTAVRFASVLEKKHNITIPDDEIGFLAIHIGLIINQGNTLSPVVSIALYATSYHGIASNIRQKLEEEYGSTVEIKPVNLSLQKLLAEKSDLVITTEHIDMIGTDTVEISPFYSSMDRYKVSNAINACIKKKKDAAENRFLMECLTPDLFFIDESITEKNDAIHFLCNKLSGFGVVDEGFEESVMAREALSPTCFFDSFAIPHALELNAHKTLFAVLINQKGIHWNDSTVKLCILFAIAKKDQKVFSNAYNGVAGILSDPSRFAKLISSNSFTEFALYIAQN